MKGQKMNTYQERIQAELDQLKAKQPSTSAKLKKIAELERLLAFSKGSK